MRSGREMYLVVRERYTYDSSMKEMRESYATPELDILVVWIRVEYDYRRYTWPLEWYRGRHWQREHEFLVRHSCNVVYRSKFDSVLKESNESLNFPMKHRYLHRAERDATIWILLLVTRRPTRHKNESRHVLLLNVRRNSATSFSSSKTNVIGRKVCMLFLRRVRRWSK